MPSGQLTLFSVDPRPLAGAECPGDTVQEPAGQAVPAPDDRQIELFAHPVVLAPELEVALSLRRFEEAARAGRPGVAAVRRSGVVPTPEGGGRRARALVRDALLNGRGPESLDFEEAPVIADLLAEDLPPRWLACLGLVRRLWSTPPP